MQPSTGRTWKGPAQCVARSPPTAATLDSMSETPRFRGSFGKPSPLLANIVAQPIRVDGVCLPGNGLSHLGNDFGPLALTARHRAIGARIQHSSQMQPALRKRIVLITGLSAIIAALVLSATAWHVKPDYPVGNVDLGSDPGMSGSLGVEPTKFYEPPTPLPDVLPGTVLRSEELTDAPPSMKAWRVLYMSKDNDGKPIAISALYLEPTKPPEVGTRFPLIAMAHGTTGFARSCGMSQGPFTPDSTGYEYNDFLMTPMINAGYAVVATDYEGMGAPGKTPYLMRKQAYDVLDSIRAAIAFRSGVVDAQQVGIVGHSEGGYVALTTADQAKTYAPELAIRGSIAIAPGVVPGIRASSNVLTTQTADIAGSPRAGYITTLSQAWLANYPDYLQPSDFYTAKGMEVVPKAAKVCQGAMLDVLTETFGTYFQAELPTTFTKVAAMNAPLTVKSPIPMMVVQGSKDTGVVPQVSKAVVMEGCARGNTMAFEEFPDDVHRSVQYSARVTMFDWLNDRFAGRPAPNQCRELG